ncbi:cellulose biosynthesis protein BcsE [Paraburkholderia eburnea]|uniref:Cellulose biosynthesis protein BcsE n=1 Tax=Paraburkholderia eburnea TaxID=1189126 RepID=A0A2S4ME40_9BURK|nr:cellulose biosynthesis protein BcsE [Paraburkholderia eburnea]POR53018.1 cellulose biosynthesis protein BcsE [Paraburkholderia eburnea]PRZ23885.1 cellulose biosynthesis protein BcsE [Paraburkholderia eburnea]
MKQSARDSAARAQTHAQPGAAPRASLLARLSQREPLAIDGLPPALAALGVGQVHIVYASASPARDTLFWETAAAALEGPATVLSTRDSASIAAMLRARGIDVERRDAIHHWANVCSLTPLEGRDGAQVLIEALEALANQCAAPASQFYIEGADAFFAWHEAATLVRQGALLANWCAQHRYGVLLVAELPDAGEDAVQPALAAFQARFAGAAQLLQTQGQFHWEVAFWRSGDSVLGSQSLPLRFSTVDHRLTVSGGTFEHSIGEAGLLAPDEGRVIVSRDAVLNERVLPPAWQVVDDNEAALNAARTAVAATVILDFGASRDLEALAEHVHTLRLQCGNALKIIVREDGVAMRYESLMLNLGANRVIARNTTLSQCEAIVESLQGQVFSRPMPADYRQALAAVMHGEESGYVSATHFVDLVRAAVERSRVIQLPNVLIRLALMPEVAHVDALKACHQRRAGDILTAAGDSLYVFFFACRLGDADAVCQRVFQRPLAELFQGEQRCGDAKSIGALLETLTDEIDTQTPPDYSGWLALNAPLEAPAQAQTPTAAAAADQAGEPEIPVYIAPREVPAADTAAAAASTPLPRLSPLPGLPVLADAAHAPPARPAAPRDEPRRATLPLKA